MLSVSDSESDPTETSATEFAVLQRALFRITVW